MKVYFDNAASTPIDKRVVDLMHETSIKYYANPSSVHENGRISRSLIETSRKNIANILNTRPGNIFFTSGGTEADNMAINCTIEKYGLRHAITTRIAHHAVLYPLEFLAKQNKIKLSYVKINDKGQVNLDDLNNLLKKNDRTFVSIMHANNEIGTIQPINEISKICNNYSAIFHSDTVQTIGHYPFDMQKLDVDFMAASAHKFYGPKGIGFIYISENIDINPLLRGGGQERNMRPGTENICSILGMDEAMTIAYSNIIDDTHYIKNIKGYMINELRKHIKGVDFYGTSESLQNDSLYTVLTVSIPENKASEMLLFNLDILGVACSGGSACASGALKGSHVFSCIDPNSKKTGIRFSFSKFNTKKEVDHTIKCLKKILYD